MIKKYQLIRNDAILDGRGDTRDWEFTIIATGETLKGLIKYAHLKKIDFYEHTIEEVCYEDGVVVEEKNLGTLIDLI